MSGTEQDVYELGSKTVQGFLDNLTVNQLADAYIKGNDECLDLLARRVMKIAPVLIAKRGLKDCNDEIMSDILLKFSTRSSFYDGRNGASFATWFYHLTRSSIDSFLNKRKRLRAHEIAATDHISQLSIDDSDTDDMFSAIPDAGPTPAEYCVYLEYKMALLECMAELTDFDATIIRWSAVGNTLECVAQKLYASGKTEKHCSAPCVNGYLITARRRLKKLMTARGFETD